MYGHSNYDNNRIALGTSNVSSTDGDQFAALGIVGTDIYRGAWWITPEAGAQYTRVRVDGYTETGGAAALTVAEDHSDSLRTSLGVRVRYQWATAWGTLTPEWRAAWQHEFLNGTRNLNASFVDVTLPGSFATTTGAPGRDFGVLGASLGGRLGTSTTASLNYDVIFGKHDFVSHLVTGKLRHTY